MTQHDPPGGGRSPLHRTLLIVEIVGGDRWGGDLESLSGDVFGGPYSATVRAVVNDEIGQGTAAAIITAHGTNPGFLGAEPVEGQ